MAKDYFQDIIPPQEPDRPRSSAERKVPVSAEDETSHETHSRHMSEPVAHDDESESVLIPRSIRDIAPLRQRTRMNDMAPSRGASDAPGVPRSPRKSSRLFLWIGAVVSLLIVGTLALFALKNTSVTVIPRSHPIAFDQTTHFTAYPAGSAASGTLTYSVDTADFEDSEVVPSQGTEHAETKASGSVTVINDYSSAPSKLVKNTRFEAPGGLIYRVPADVIIPGKKGTTPGQIDVTVVADASGEQYNIGPTARFSVPGLKSTPAMYNNIYARSSTAMSGGFLGDRPAVAASALQAAHSAIRSRIESKIQESIRSRTHAVIFPDLVRITYSEKPNTPEAGNSVRVHDSAHVEMPMLPDSEFATAIAQSVSADVEGSTVRIVAGPNYVAHADATSTTLGSSPLDFTISGQATLVWDVDVASLAKALAGRDETAFQTIVTGFPGIQEAHARIEPFWKNTFPRDPSSITVTVQSPKATQ